jgi:hypothetical protein
MQKLPRGAMIRMLYCLQVLTISFFSISYDNSIIHELVKCTQGNVWLIVGSMCALAGIGIADFIVNDFMPAKYQLACALHIRHAVYMLIAIGYAILMSFAVKHEMYATIPYFMVNIIFIVVSAFTDVQRRYKSPEFKRKTDKENIHA